MGKKGREKSDECMECMEPEEREIEIRTLDFEALALPFASMPVADVAQGLSLVFGGLGKLFQQGGQLQAVKMPPHDLGEGRKPDYVDDAKTGRPVLVKGKTKATCDNTVYYGYRVIYTLPWKTVEEVSALTVLAALSQAMHDAQKKAAMICAPLKDCPVAQTLVIAWHWHPVVRGTGENRRVHLDIGIIVRVRCRKAK